MHASGGGAQTRTDKLLVHQASEGKGEQRRADTHSQRYLHVLPLR